MESMVSLAGAILILCCVLALAYWCSRFLGTGMVRASSGRNIKIIEQLRLGTDKQILILKIREHTYLVGVSQSEIRLLAELEGEFDEDMSGQRAGGFSSALGEALKRHTALYRKEKKDE